MTTLLIDTEAQVAAAYNRYAAAYSAHDETATILTRYELCSVLVETGWRPPPVVAQQMELDRVALDRPLIIQL